MNDTHNSTLFKDRSLLLPDAICALFDGSCLETPSGEAFSLLTVDEMGRPHTSLLSAGELWVPDGSSMRVALWPSARAVAHLARSHRAALSGVCADTFFQIQLDQVEVLGNAQGLQCFTAHVEYVETQRVAYARLQNGIVFVLEDDAVLVRWRAQLAALKSL
jgi:hypothetical protein